MRERNKNNIFPRTGYQLRYNYLLKVCVRICYHAYTNAPVRTEHVLAARVIAVYNHI